MQNEAKLEVINMNQKKQIDKIELQIAEPGFPSVRMRRPRRHNWSRRMLQENHLNVEDLIWPLFVTDGALRRSPIASMPGVERLSIDLIVEQAVRACEIGIPCLALFPQIDPDKKNVNGTEAFNPDNLICRTVRAIRAAKLDIGILCDVALDPYTSHGHDGVLDENGYVENDKTVELLVQQSLIQAEAGCDILAPSDMMDGRIGVIRNALERRGFTDVMLMSYAVKYASAFYGPFRDAVGSKGALVGDKKTYQMNPGNELEGLREVALDIKEGADMVMVKPGMPYLDMVTKIKQNFSVPTFAYQVSGEYAMIKAAGLNGWLDEEKTMFESLLAFKRAGADGILSYAAYDVAQNIKKGTYGG